MQDTIRYILKENDMNDTKTTDKLSFLNNEDIDDRRWACPSLFRMPMSGDGKLCRIRLEQGHINANQLLILAQCIKDYGDSLLEITTRANVQIRGIAEHNAPHLSAKLVAAGFGSKVKNGDDIPNIMVNPTIGIDQYALKNISPFVEQLSFYIQKHYQQLSPKFSFFIDAGEACAILNHKSDIWLSLCDNGQNFSFGLNSCPTTTSSPIKAMGKVAYEQGHQLIYALIELLLYEQLNHPHIQRMKHLLEKLNSNNILNKLKRFTIDVQSANDFCRNKSTNHYLGIYPTKKAQHYYLGIKPPFARLTPKMLIYLADILSQYPDNNGLYFTPWQSIIFPNCSESDAKNIAAKLQTQDFIINADDIRAKITCCVGAPKCMRGKSNSLIDAKILAHLLKDKNINQKIHITGCPKSCAATQIYPITLLGKGKGIYDIYNHTPPLKQNQFGTLVGENLNLEQAADFIRKTNLSCA